MKHNQKLVKIAGILLFVSQGLESFEIMKKDSSQVDYIGTNEEKKILFVQFKNGASYIYENVDHVTLQNARRAISIGSFLQTDIKEKFPFKKVEDCIKVATVDAVHEGYEALRRFRNENVGKWVTENPEAFNGHPKRNLLDHLTYEI